MTDRTITPKHLYDLIQRGESVELVDVRTPVEFREVHAEFARNIPLDAFDPQTVMSDRNGSSPNPLYVICRSGGRAAKACEKLVASGHENVVNVEGGTLAWEEAGLPVKRGKKAVSLERQVRIAAGFLILTGVVLGFAVHPGFFGLSGFVGAGLMFAGITDTCAMGMLISKMPWNQVSECQSK
ncbi:MAG: rhodanese-like domain-containing protein [Planctomycetes bacterium]|nr:rhodanese-like domain-containing protein [Planctomycetota bacterium]